MDLVDPVGKPKRAVPVKVVFSPDMLPRNPTGKLMKGELKKLFAETQHGKA